MEGIYLYFEIAGCLKYLLNSLDLLMTSGLDVVMVLRLGSFGTSSVRQTSPRTS